MNGRLEVARTTETTIKVRTVGGAAVSHTLELSEAKAELRIQAGSHSLILGRTLPEIRNALADLKETAHLLEEELDRRYPSVLNSSVKLIEQKPKAN